MRTLDDIKYEIAFIEQEIVNGDFPYLEQDELQTWLVALRWTLKESERWKQLKTILEVPSATARLL